MEFLWEQNRLEEEKWKEKRLKIFGLPIIYNEMEIIVGLVKCIRITTESTVGDVDREQIVEYIITSSLVKSPDTVSQLCHSEVTT